MPIQPLNGEIRYRDASIEDMMGTPPGWLLRSGLGMLGVVIVVAIGLAGMIDYPEKVEVPFVLQTETVPLELRPIQPSFIDELAVADGDTVGAGDTLIVFRTDGDWRTVALLKEWLNKTKNLSSDKLLAARPPVAAYPARLNQFVEEILSINRAHQSYRTTNGVAERVTSLRREIAEAKNLSGSLDRQVDLYDNELTYKDRNASRNRTLAEQGVISDQEAEVVEEQLVAARRQR